MYAGFSDIYESLFPCSDEAADYFTELLRTAEAGASVVDIGCGTGELLRRLARARPDLSYLGIEPDRDMLRTAGERALPGMRFAAGGMEDFAACLPPDAALPALVSCLGNTLAHLRDESALESFFGSVHRSLAPGGAVVVQILNYERIREHGLRSLPPIETAEWRFERFYHPLGQSGESMRYEFATTLSPVRGDAPRIDGSVELCGFEALTLVRAFSKSGFTEPGLRGGYADPRYSPRESPVLLATARKD